MFISDGDIELEGYEGEWLVEFTDVGVFTCKCTTNPYAPTLIYKLDKLPHQLNESQRQSVLDYRLGANNYGVEELVTIGDMFMEGSYITAMQ